MDSQYDWLRRIVRIEARLGSSQLTWGTGFRVAPGKILTAQHVIESAQKIDVSVDPGGGGNVLKAQAKVVWRGEADFEPKDRKALDVALLEDELPGDDLEPFHRWVRVPLGRSGKWETEGFAAGSPRAKRMETEYLWGTCHPARELATYVQLTVKRDSPLGAGTWKGTSGAPVFVKGGPHSGCFYGVVRSGPQAYDDSLYAVITPALLRNHELRGHLGIKDPAPPHASLVEKLRELLAEDAELTRRLAQLDPAWEARWRSGGSGGVDDLVDVICATGRLKPVLEGLQRLAKESMAPNENRIRELAIVLVSILAAREVPGGENLTVESTSRIQLGTASPYFAEALLASAYGVPCKFEKAEVRDLPRASLRVQASTMEAGIRSQSQVREQLDDLVTTLVNEDLDPKFILDGDRALLSRASPDQRQKFVQHLLEDYLTRLRKRKGRPAFMTFDADLQEKMGSQLGSFLARLEKILPSLDLVVLDTETEKIDEAIEQHQALWRLWEILDLLPED